MAPLWILVLYTYTNVHTCNCACISEMHFFVNTFFFFSFLLIMPDEFHLWHFTGNKTYYTVRMSTTRKKEREFNTLPPVSHGRWKQVQGGLFIPRHTATHSHTQAQMSIVSDSISFVYACRHTQVCVKWGDNSLLMNVLLPSLKKVVLHQSSPSQSWVGRKE